MRGFGDGNRVRLCTVAATALLAAQAGNVRAVEWFVSTTGSDQTGTGSMAQPFRTIGHVLDPGEALLEPGDIVTLRGPVGNNTYNECEVRLRLPLTLRSHAGEMAHIHCDITNIDTVAIQIDPEASGSNLSRLEVSGGYYYALFFQTDWFTGGGEAGTGASNVLVDQLRIHDSGRDAIKITPKCNNITISNSEIFNSGAIYPPGTPLEDKNAEGIDNVNGSGMHVHDNHIHDIATNGLYFKGGAADVIIERNRIERVGEGGIMVGYDTSPEFFDLALNPQYYESIRGLVRNNIIRDTGYAGIGLYAALDAKVLNNTIINSAVFGHAALYFGVTLQDFEPQAGRPPSVNPLIRNNLVIQNGGDCLRVRWANELGGLSGLNGNPGSNHNWFHDSTGACNFADNRPGSPLDGGATLAQWRAFENSDSNSHEAAISVTADGHLPAGSPALDQGQTLAQVTDDFDRQPRSGPNDIGADERDAAAVFGNGFE